KAAVEASYTQDVTFTFSDSVTLDPSAEFTFAGLAETATVGTPVVDEVANTITITVSSSETFNLTTVTVTGVKGAADEAITIADEAITLAP
ncbi:hypothetical protein, partial [Lysinibacillus boronitolerans]|uniref:hypothetical protein n=1 Tax=Lysinibacillus boronitolerans TaxID=309788 RepID=UPI0013E3673A